MTLSSANKSYLRMWMGTKAAMQCAHPSSRKRISRCVCGARKQTLHGEPGTILSTMGLDAIPDA